MDDNNPNAERQEKRRERNARYRKNSDVAETEPRPLATAGNRVVKAELLSANLGDVLNERKEKARERARRYRARKREQKKAVEESDDDGESESETASSHEQQDKRLIFEKSKLGDALNERKEKARERARRYRARKGEQKKAVEKSDDDGESESETGNSHEHQDKRLRFENRQIKIPQAVDASIQNDSLRSITENLKCYRKVCMVCNRLMSPRLVKTYVLEDYATLEQRLKQCCLRPDLKVKLINEIERTARFEWNVEVPNALIEFYDVSDLLGDKFKGCLLSRKGVVVENGRKSVIICDACHGGLRLPRKNAKKKDHFAPPKFAIANGLWIGAWPSYLPEMTRGEQVSLALFTPFYDFRVLQRSKKDPRKVHCALSLFRSGDTIAAVLLPRIPEDQGENPIQVLFERNSRIEADEQEFLYSKYLIHVDKLEAIFNFLVCNNVVYKERFADGRLRFARENLEIIREVQFSDGRIVSFVDMQEEELEKSTPIGKSGEEIVELAVEPIAEGKLSDGPIEIITQLGTSFFPPLTDGIARQFEALESTFTRSVRVKETKEHVGKQIRNIRIGSGNERAFSTEPDVVEGALFWKYPFGTGTYLQPRQVKLTQSEYYGSVMCLADGNFGSDNLFISIAHDANSFEKASHATFRLKGEAASRLATTSADNILEAIRSEVDDIEAAAANTVGRIPAEVRDILTTIRRVRASTPGSKRSKLSDRAHLLGQLTKEGLPHLFVTFNPSNPQSILIFDNINREATAQPFSRDLNAKIARTINEDIEGQVYFFEESIHHFIKHAIGWRTANDKDGDDWRPSKNGGTLGRVKAFFGVPEATGQSHLHSHWLIWLEDAPRGPMELRGLIDKNGREEVLTQLIKYAESIAVSHFPERFFLKDNSICQCGAKLEALNDLGARFRLRKRLANDEPIRVRCVGCKKAWTAEQFIHSRVRDSLSRLGQVSDHECLHDFYRAYVIKHGMHDIRFDQTKIPSDLHQENLDDLDAEFRDCILALFYFDVQHHDPRHRATCEKKGCACRMREPKAMRSASHLDEDVFHYQVPLLSEFFRVAVAGIGLAFHCNTDLQVLFTITNGGALIIYYIVKYVAKPQDGFARKDINVIINSHHQRFIAARDRKGEQMFGEPMSVVDLKSAQSNEESAKAVAGLGKRLVLSLNKILSDGDEIDHTMCIHFLKTGKSFWSSHKQVRFNYSKVFSEFFECEENNNEVTVKLDRSKVGQGLFSENAFYSQEDYEFYLGRPQHPDIEKLSLAQFLCRYKSAPVKKGQDPDDVAIMLIEPYRLRHVHVLQPLSGKHSLTVVGPSIPDHFEFESEVYALLERNPLFEEMDKMDVVGDEEALRDKKERFAFYLLVHYVPHRNGVRNGVRSLLEENDPSFWSAFVRAAPTIADVDKDEIVTILESKASPDTRSQKREWWETYEREAMQDLKTEAARRKQEGVDCYVTVHDEEDDPFADTTKTIVEFKEKLRTRTKEIALTKEWKYNLAGLNSRDFPSVTEEGLVTTTTQTVDSYQASLSTAAPDNDGVIVSTAQDAGARAPMTIEINSSTKIDVQNSKFTREHSITQVGLAIQLNYTQMMATRLYGSRIDYALDPKGAVNPFPAIHFNEQLKGLLYGEGGSGKSYVIRALTDYAISRNRPRLVLKTSQFGSPASMIGGYTTASLIGQRKSGKYDLEAKSSLLKDAIILIVDEITLSTRQTLYYLHQAMQLAKGNDRPFGGVHLLFAGDPFQLGPVGSLRVFEFSDKQLNNDEVDESAVVVYGLEGESKVQKTKTRKAKVSSVAKSTRRINEEFVTETYMSFNVAFVLTVQKRFANQENLKGASRAYRSGYWKQRHVDFLNSRIVKGDEVNFSKSITLVAEVVERKAFLYSRCLHLETAGNCIAWLPQLEIVKNKTKKHATPDIDISSLSREELMELQRRMNDCFWDASTSKAKEVIAYSIYRIGDLVTVTENLSVEGNVANGSFGKLERLSFPKETRFEDVSLPNGEILRIADRSPIVVWVEMSSRGADIRGYGCYLRPVWQVETAMTTRLSTTSDRTSRIKFCNVPILPASCVTVHGSQGKSIAEEYAVVITDIWKTFLKERPEAFYVALTRPKLEEQLKFLLDQLFTLEFCKALVPSNLVKNEHRRVWKLFEETLRRLDPSASCPEPVDLTRFRSSNEEPIGVNNIDQHSSFLCVAVQLLRAARASIEGSDAFSTDMRSLTTKQCDLHNSSEGYMLGRYVGETIDEHNQMHRLKELFERQWITTYSDIFKSYGSRFSNLQDILKKRMWSCPDHRERSKRETDMMLMVDSIEWSKEGFDLVNWLRTKASTVKRVTGCGSPGCTHEIEEVTKYYFSTDMTHLLIVFEEDSKLCQLHINFPESFPLEGFTFHLKAAVEHGATLSSMENSHYYTWLRPNLREDWFHKVDDAFVYSGVKFHPQMELCNDEEGVESLKERSDCPAIKNRAVRALLYEKREYDAL